MSELKDGKSFASLWNKFDLVYERCTFGRHDLKYFKQFLEERSKIEEQYASSLAKLVAKTPDFEVPSSYTRCWTELKSTTKNLSEQHSQLATAFTKEIGAVLDSTMNRLKSSKTALLKEHQNLEADLKRKQSNHDRAYSRYKDAVKQAETAVLNYDSGQKEHLPEKTQKALDAKK